MSHIFISYSTKNSEYAYKLADKLRDEGFNVWIDNDKLRSADNWWESIVKALRAADAFIVIMTPEARESEWVQIEIHNANNWEKPAFPLLLDGDNFEIYVLTQFRDVKDKSLPQNEFYESLERYTPRKTTRGENITEDEVDTADSANDFQEEIAKPQSPYTQWAWFVATTIILFLSLSFLNLSRLPNQILTLTNQLFSLSGGNELLFNISMLLSIILLLAIGGGISITYIRHFHPWLNQTLHGWSFIPRRLLPVPAYTLIATVFIIFVAETNWLILPSLEDYLNQQIIEDIERDSTIFAANNLPIIVSNVSSYANSLTLLGLEYENTGQGELAKETYQRVLLEDSTMLGVRYLLANLLLDENNSQNAIPILDEGLRQLDLYEDEEITINSIEPENPDILQHQETQIRYLLLGTRGRAFLQLSSARLALQDLGEVKDLIESNDIFFITGDDLEGVIIEPLEGINTIEFYYYYALANEARQQEESDNGDERSAELYEQVAFDAWENVILLSSQRNNDYQARLWNSEANERISSQ